MRKISPYALTALLLIVVHATILNFVTIGNAIPDIILIWVVYVAITTGQLTGTITGFFVGIIVDLLSGGVLGLSALAKTLAGFVGGYFFNENKIEQTLSTSKFVIAVGIASVLHNAIYFLIFLQGTDVGWARAVALHGIPSALYTTVLAVVPMAIFRRRYQ
jgi:rod shape-determining protein MreD